MSTTLISDERKRILRGLGKANSPAERQWQSDFVKCVGLPGCTFIISPPDGDYEGAILARQERLEF